MNAVQLNLDAELASMDPADAERFRQAVRTMLSLWKSPPKQARQSFAQRIAQHPAIGTWPASKDVDQHISHLRSEWGE